MKLNVSCVILAGGESRRMGQNKASMHIAGGDPLVRGFRLFDYIYGKCHGLFSEIIIVTNTPQEFSEYQAHIVVDEIVGAGSLGGLYTGLLKASKYHSFCVACDMPFLQPEVILHLTRRRFNYDVVIPNVSTGLEPLHAVYSKRCIGPMKKNLRLGELKLTKFLSDIRVRYVGEKEIKKIDPFMVSFTNVNTRKDLLTMQRILQGEQWEKKLEAT